jgi:hypothetical protein
LLLCGLVAKPSIGSKSLHRIFHPTAIFPNIHFITNFSDGLIKQSNSRGVIHLSSRLFAIELLINFHSPISSTTFIFSKKCVQTKTNSFHSHCFLSLPSPGRMRITQVIIVDSSMVNIRKPRRERRMTSE